ncbi:YkgJ family cysteine cluster protein [Treponema phagedenis]|uniref:YkgJ family cysteine cluster protein n=1 Tax=Treponema phagedenis TaxID=162 RepID=UPI0001F63F46|nr:YkgJ family cysteine cluster protein [Treponema phagedenis]EFW37495.1 hypothetical protein HMPREF9554_02071 [Treponema phagedenis F0421]TYT78259.1 YkgJ family cysteine cluster protein [Treponema phagedenis]
MKRPFWESGLYFSCTRCSVCCRFDPGFVYLSETDFTNLLHWSELSEDDFIKKYCRWVEKNDGYEYLCLQEKPNYDCILWNEGCVAYQYRPLQCSAYPFWSSLLVDEDWWNVNATGCPGCNQGAYHAPEEIRAALLKERLQPPIRRKK